MSENSILIYANYAAPYEGNFFASQKKLAFQLQSINYNVIILLPSEARKYSWAEELSSKFMVYYQKGISRDRTKVLNNIIKRNNVILVHTHFVPVKDIAELKIVLFLNKKRNTKIIEHFHNHYTKGNLFFELIKRRINKDVSFIGCSKDVYDDFSLFALKNRADYVENAIDFSRLDNVDVSFRLDDDSFRIMILGFDYYRKGVDIALDAISRLRVTGRNISLYIVLSTNHDYVKKQIVYKFGDKVEWIKILDSRNDIGTYYNAMNLFISPSREEGFCYAIIESGYCKLLTVASDISGQRKENINEIIWCEGDSIVSLESCIKEAMDLTDEERMKKVTKLKKECIENFGLERWVDKMMMIYKGWNII